MKKEKEKTPKVKDEPAASEQPSKMRIKLFNGGTLISDRLVEQVTELNKGPVEVHKGPISIEFNLHDQEEVSKSIAYLQQLKGDLPIVSPDVKAKLKKVDKMLSKEEPVEDLYKLIGSKPKTQEQLIDTLREYNYRFLTYQTILDGQEGLEIPQIKLLEKHKDYQFMARMVKEAKNPLNDKYDYRLTVGIQLVGERHELVKVYLWGKFDSTLKIPWENAKKVNFKKVDLMFTFPEWMDLDDRKKWRVEHRKWRTATEDGKFPEKFDLSKSYKKAAPYIKKLG